MDDKSRDCTTDGPNPQPLPDSEAAENMDVTQTGAPPLEGEFGYVHGMPEQNVNTGYQIAGNMLDPDDIKDRSEKMVPNERPVSEDELLEIEETEEETPAEEEESN